MSSSTEVLICVYQEILLLLYFSPVWQLLWPALKLNLSVSWSFLRLTDYMLYGIQRWYLLTTKYRLVFLDEQHIHNVSDQLTWSSYLQNKVEDRHMKVNFSKVGAWVTESEVGNSYRKKQQNINQIYLKLYFCCYFASFWFHLPFICWGCSAPKYPFPLLFLSWPSRYRWT